MGRFIATRAWWGLVTLFTFITLTFFAVNLLFPFDFVSATRELGVPPAQVEELQRPLLERYLSYLGGLVRGDLGTSYGGGSVSAILFGRAIPVTLLVFVLGSIVAYLFGSWLGRAVAWTRSRLASSATTTAGVLTYTAFPPWLVFVLVYLLTEPLHSARSLTGLPIDSLHVWRDSAWQPNQVMARMAVGLLLALILAVVARTALRRLGFRRWSTLLSLPLPLGAVVASWYYLGYGNEAVDLLFRGSPAAWVGRGSPVLMLIAFVLLAFGEIAFVTRTSMAAEAPEQYVTIARAKGLKDHDVREKHVAPNALLPTLSRFFVGIPYILTGLVIIEYEFAVRTPTAVGVVEHFSIQGVSSVLFNAVSQLDVPVILGTLVVLGVVLLLARLGLEVLHGKLDPRLRVRGEDW
ncbi:MAG: ABC transporter permease [Nitriliruptorales bacterium]|nr:ABC transporter permease [Nitriliruptorales bacterium]